MSHRPLYECGGNLDRRIVCSAFLGSGCMHCLGSSTARCQRHGANGSMTLDECYRKPIALARAFRMHCDEVLFSCMGEIIPNPAELSRAQSICRESRGRATNQESRQQGSCIVREAGSIVRKLGVPSSFRLFSFLSAGGVLVVAEEVLRIKLRRVRAASCARRTPPCQGRRSASR